MSSTAVSFAPVQAGAGKAIELAMQRLWLTGRILPAGARLTVQHVFQSAEDKPLEVIYAFPLPRDAALRSFRITGEGFEAHSELRQAEEAVKAYEEGIAQGSLSTLARQYGDGVINLTVGNIRPKETVTVYLEILAGVELRDDSFRFRFPFTLAPAYHSRMKAAVVTAGEGEMELPPDEFGDVILPRFRQDASSLHQVGFDLSVVTQLGIDEIGSPSHAVRVSRNRVSLAPERDVPDRDLVLDARFKEVAPQILAGPGKDGKGRFAAIVPSSSFGANPETPRRVVILLDRSGSMGGAPIAQARKAIEACLGALSETDSFGLVAYDDKAETFRPSLLTGTRENRDQARRFLANVDARGGTELVKGVLEGAKLFHGEGGDMLIFTDGQVSGTEQILADAGAAHIRLHCLGIGSASQDRFLALLARETGGVSRFVTPRERVDLAAVDLFASVGRPVASGLKAAGNIQPQPPAVVFSGTPVLLFGEVDRELELTWDGGRLSLPVDYTDSAIGETVWLLQGSRLITDWESRYPSAEAWAPLEKRQQSRVAMRLQALSAEYGLASREMSLVAVVKRAGDRPGELPQTRVVPLGMPQDINFEAYFRAGGFAPAPAMAGVHKPTMIEAPCCIPHESYSPADAAKPKSRWNMFARRAAPANENAADALMDLAAQIEPDGGMPGKDAEARAAATIVALMAFVSQGHTSSSGAFRSHVARLISFLKSLQGLSGERRKAIVAALRLASAGTAPEGDWIAESRASGDPWSKIEKAVQRA